jgi:NAD(P)-dependent dehydrogenase (short-subunit alcohol dehydrogenase family)
MTDLNGKVVLVTGSSRGIGAEIAVAFARHGAKVVLHGRDTEALAKVQADITNGGGQAMFVTGDVTKFADIETFRARVEQTYGLVDVLIACAGGSGSRPGPIEDIGEGSWRADLDTNLTATFLTIKSLSARHEEAGKRQHHHHLIRGRPPGQCPHARGVRGGEGRCPAAHPRPRCPGRSPWYSGQLHRPGDDPD